MRPLVAVTERVDGTSGERSAADEVTLDLAADVLFAFDSAALTPAAQATLERVGQEVRDRAAPGALTVTGHTDDRGEDAYNDRLSRARADAVAAALRPRLAGADLQLRWRRRASGSRWPTTTTNAAGSRTAASRSPSPSGRPGDEGGSGDRGGAGGARAAVRLHVVRRRAVVGARPRPRPPRRSRRAAPRTRSTRRTCRATCWRRRRPPTAALEPIASQTLEVDRFVEGTMTVVVDVLRLERRDDSTLVTLALSSPTDPVEGAAPYGTVFEDGSAGRYFDRIALEDTAAGVRHYPLSWRRQVKRDLSPPDPGPLNACVCMFRQNLHLGPEPVVMDALYGPLPDDVDTVTLVAPDGLSIAGLEVAAG